MLTWSMMLFALANASTTFHASGGDVGDPSNGKTTRNPPGAMAEPKGSVYQLLPPSREISACTAYRLSAWFCGLNSSIQLSVLSEKLPGGSVQFQLVLGLESTSLIHTLPGVEGGRTGVPASGGGVLGAHPCVDAVACRCVACAGMLRRAREEESIATTMLRARERDHN